MWGKEVIQREERSQIFEDFFRLAIVEHAKECDHCHDIVIEIVKKFESKIGIPAKGTDPENTDSSVNK